MKKITLFCIALLIGSAGIYAQDDSFFNKKLRIELMDFLVSMKMISSDDYNDFLVVIKKPTSDESDIINFDLSNLPYIKNELTGENMTLHPDKYEYGIYSFTGNILHGPKHILLKKGSEHQILQMNGWDWGDGKGIRHFDKIVLDLFQYFKENPNIDSKLLPLYTDAVFRVYYENYKLTPPTTEHIKEEYKKILNGEEEYYIIE